MRGCTHYNIPALIIRVTNKLIIRSYYLKCKSWFNLERRLGTSEIRITIGHFRVSPSLCIKTRLSAQPLIWKWFFILVQIKLNFTRKVEHLASFWNWEFLELGRKACGEKNELFKWNITRWRILSDRRQTNWPCTTMAERLSSVITEKQIQVGARVGLEKGAYCALITWSRYLIGETGHWLLPFGFLGSFWQPRSSLEFWRGIQLENIVYFKKSVINHSSCVIYE